MARRYRGNVVRGRFRGNGQGGGPTGLPPELTTLLKIERKKQDRRRYFALWGGAIVVGAAVGAGPTLWQAARPLISSVSSDVPRSSGLRTSFSICHTGGGYNCVVDGDTVWLKGQNIRVADIDTPETHEPRCASEKALGDRATLRLQQLLNGGQVSLQSINRDTDSYGRKLRLVMVDGESVGDTLVSEGLARWYAGGKRPWC